MLDFSVQLADSNLIRTQKSARYEKIDPGYMEVSKISATNGQLSDADIPQVGQIVHLRSRTHLVDGVLRSPAATLGTLVKVVLR
jgi:hypothetical protein